MFRAEIQWLASGPTLKLEGKLVADWAEQARCLVTKDVLPKGLIVDLTEVIYRFSGRTVTEVVGWCRRSVCARQCLCNCRMRPAGFIAYAEDSRATQAAAWE